MRISSSSWLFFILVVCLAACVPKPTDLKPVKKDGVPRISIHSLKSRLGQKDLVLLDTRQTQQWKVSSKKIPGAVHHSSFEVEDWAQEYSLNATIVTYCA